MKHYYLFILFVTFVGCAPKQLSNEEKVIKEFKNYAKTHFDDPSQLKEIIGIDEIDTISTIPLKKKIKKSVENLRTLDSLHQYYDSVFYRYAENYPNKIRNNYPLRFVRDRAEILDNSMTLLLQGISVTQLEKRLEQLMVLKDSTLYQHQIVYRLMEPGGLKIRYFYCFTDTLYTSFSFSNNKASTKEEPFNAIITEVDENLMPMIMKLDQHYEHCLKNDRFTYSVLQSLFSDIDK